MFERLAHIKHLQRAGEAEALYNIALQAPPGCQMVELGTYHGYTAGVLGLAAAEISADVVTIDNYEPMPKIGRHIGPEGVRKNLKQAGLYDDVSVIKGDSRVVPGGILDVGLLWIDSTHTAEHLLSELAAWLPHVIAGGIVAFHDYGGANTPQLKPPIDAAFKDNPAWQQVGACYTVIGFKRLR